MPGPLGQGSVTSFEPFHTSKQKYPSVPERNKKRWKVEQNYIDDGTSVTIYVCTCVGKWGRDLSMEHPPSVSL